MAIFELKVHENAIAAGLCSGPRWGSLQRSPDPRWINGPLRKSLATCDTGELNWCALVDTAML